MRTTRGILAFVNITEFRVGPEQLPLLNRGLIKTAAAQGDVAEERIWNLIQQGIAHREVLGINLIQIEAAGDDVDAVVADVGDVQYVVGSRRILESIHPLLSIVRLAVA